MSSFEREWENDRWEEDAPARWERAEERERAEETERDRLTRDVAARKGKPRPDYNPRVDHPERYMRDGVWGIDV